MEKKNIFAMLKDVDKNEAALYELATQNPIAFQKIVNELLTEQLAIFVGSTRESLDSYKNSNKEFRKWILLHKKGHNFLKKFTSEEIIRINQMERKIPEIDLEISKIEEVVSHFTKEDVVNKDAFQARLDFIRSWQEEVRKFLSSKK